MKILRNLHLTIMLGLASTLFSACDGLFEDVYDNDKVAETSSSSSLWYSPSSDTEGQFTIDATSYTAWHYISFADMTLTSSVINADGTEDDVPDQWDIALHRYDVKTNGGSAAATSFSTFASLSLDNLSFEADVWTENKITIDMSHMMEGYLVYAPSYYSAVISGWVDVDTSTMPPIYTMNSKVYVLMTSDGRLVALRLINYMNDSSVKGHMTVEYSILDSID